MQELCGAGKEYPPSKYVRGQLIRLSKAFGIPRAKRVPGRKANGCATWSKLLEEKIAELATDPNLRVLKLAHDRTVVSFMVVFESMWKFLEDLHREGVLEFCALGQTTHLELNGRGILGALLAQSYTDVLQANAGSLLSLFVLCVGLVSGRPTTRSFFGK